MIIIIYYIYFNIKNVDLVFVSSLIVLMLNVVSLFCVLYAFAPNTYLLFYYGTEPWSSIFLSTILFMRNKSWRWEDVRPYFLHTFSGTHILDSVISSLSHCLRIKSKWSPCDLSLSILTRITVLRKVSIST